MPRDLTPVQPDLHTVFKKFPRLPLNGLSVRVLQWLMGLMPDPAISKAVQMSTVRVQSEDAQPDVRLRVFKPVVMTTTAPALLWIHGGGLVIGNPRQDDIFVAKFAEELGMVVVSVQYRLAPVHPFPAAIEDCYTALKWIHDNVQALGVDPERIAVGGRSAGAGLAASLAQLAHDRGDVKIAFQFLVYPMLDDRSTLRTDLPHADLLTWTVDNNRFGWESYLRQKVGSVSTPAYAVPSRRDDLSGLPPAWIGVGTLDLFYEEAVAYADQLTRCGVACEIAVIDGAFHGFDVFDNEVPTVQDFHQAQMTALRKYLLQD